MEFVDTHCHLNHRDFDDDRQAVLERASTARVRRLLVIGYDLASSRRAVELSLASQEEDLALYAVIGIHPESAGEWGDETRAALQDLHSAAGGRVVAYGEIGLDYHWETIPRDRQQVVFAEQIAFAQTLTPGAPSPRTERGLESSRGPVTPNLTGGGLPIIIHCRDAMEDVLAVLRESGTRSAVVMHCFTGGADAARACLDAGYYLGIGGVATFKKSDEVRETIAYAPIERLLLETDCPYLAPQKWRGRRNEPSYLTAVAETVASVKGMSVEEVAAVTTANASRLFGLG